MEKLGFEGIGGTLPSSRPLLPPHGRLEQLTEPPKCVTINRNGIGRNGSCIDLVANHFKVSVTDPDAVFFQYSVLIKSEDNQEVERKDIGRKVMDKLFQTFSSKLAGKNFAYDEAKALYTVGPLPKKKSEFTIVLDEAAVKCSDSPDLTGMEIDRKRTKGSVRSKTYNVEISFAAEIPMKPIAQALKGLEAENTVDALNVIDIVLSQQAAKRRCLIQQSFSHDDVRNFVNIGGGTVCCGLPLNIDVSSTMILTPTPVLDFILTNQNLRDPRQIDWGMAKKMLKKLRVKAAHTNKEFQIIGISEKACNQQYFPLKMRSGDGSTEETVEITVYEYFKNRKIELSNSACMPCLEVGKLNRLNYLPLELCSLISSQHYTKALSSMQRSSLVEKSRQKSQERIQTVTDLKVGITEDCIPRRWDFNQKRLLSSIQIKRWAIVNFSAHCDFSYLSQELIKCGRSKGIHIDNPHSLIEEDPQWRGAVPLVRVEKLFKQVKAKLPGRPDFLLCIFPERKNSDIYGPWKKKCLHEMGIFTQCLSPTKINDQHLTNVLLNIICKLGDMNSLLEADRIPNFLRLEETPTMISGIDVSHGSPGQSDVPSLTAVAGSSLWPLISSYREPVRTLPPMVEMIDSFFKLLPNGEDDGIIRDELMDMSSGTMIAAMKYNHGIYCACDSKMVRPTGDEYSQPKIEVLGDNVVLMFAGKVGRYVILRANLDHYVEGRARMSQPLDIEEIAFRIHATLQRTNNTRGCVGKHLKVFVCGYHRVQRVLKIYVISDRWNRVHERDFCVGGKGCRVIRQGVHYDFPDPSHFFPRERTACEVVGAVQAAIEGDPVSCGGPVWLCHITAHHIGSFRGHLCEVRQSKEGSRLLFENASGDLFRIFDNTDKMFILVICHCTFHFFHFGH